MIGKLFVGAILLSAVSNEMHRTHDKRNQRLHRAGVRAGGLDGLAQVKAAQERTPYIVGGMAVCGAVVGWVLAGG